MAVEADDERSPRGKPHTYHIILNSAELLPAALLRSYTVFRKCVNVYEPDERVQAVVSRVLQTPRCSDITLQVLEGAAIRMRRTSNEYVLSLYSQDECQTRQNGTFSKYFAEALRRQVFAESNVWVRVDKWQNIADRVRRLE